MELNRLTSLVQRLIATESIGGARSEAFPNTKAMFVVTALGCALWISSRAIQLPAESNRERRCFETMTQIQSAMLRYRSSHQGAFPTTMSALQAGNPQLRLVCASSQQRSAASTYVLPIMLQHGLTNDSHSLGTVAVICNEHARQTASIDQPMLILTWDGQRFRIPKSKVRELKAEPLFNPGRWQFYLEH